MLMVHILLLFLSLSLDYLCSVNTLSSAPDLSNDELAALKLKDTNKNNDYALYLKLPKGKVNGNNFEECIKLSTPIAPIPSGSIK